ncbi:hypothetical protein LJ737_12805 [Hymenobacter sp. 15J16-1T3B]|uniref:hypothetical protein n=1 Tax=Hymenobacter sp. 15J16-1T3B TaxID=2886941 RepID=UPI001D10ADAA|nr:hypothetical protein [Hymenobacter sp. 15J16-1T3B]MCC3158121.1 hypothetical protein [Hymenobacter sp. 15J16-1T3B]
MPNLLKTFVLAGAVAVGSLLTSCVSSGYVVGPPPPPVIVRPAPVIVTPRPYYRARPYYRPAPRPYYGPRYYGHGHGRRW